MTVKELLECYDAGDIVFVNSEDEVISGTLPAQSPMIAFIEDLEVISWKAATSHSKPKIFVTVDLSKKEQPPQNNEEPEVTG